MRAKAEPPQKKTFDLDPATDAFYAELGGSPFPEAIEANAQQLQEVTAKEEAMHNEVCNLSGPLRRVWLVARFGSD